MTFNSMTRWGWPAKTLHWVGAIIILLLLGHGWWMTHMTPRPERLANYAGHSALGYDLLVLIVLRLVWRWLNPVPELPADLKPWERLAARTGHISLYVLMLVVSLTGLGGLYIAGRSALHVAEKDRYGSLHDGNVPALGATALAAAFPGTRDKAR